MKFQFKPFISVLLTAVMLILVVSGVMLYVAPRGRVANWGGWTLWGLEKHDWQSVHMNIALLFLVVAGLHLYLNWAIFWSYLKKKGSLALNLKLETLLALLVAAAVLTGVILRVTPFTSLMTWNFRIKDYWEREEAIAPSPHADELSLTDFARNLGLSADDVAAALREQGFNVTSVDETIGKLAEANGRTPAELYSAIEKAFPGERLPEAGRGKGRGMGGGQGRGPGKGRGRHGGD